MEQVKELISNIQDKYKVPVEVMTMIMVFASTRFVFNDEYHYQYRHIDCSICMDVYWPPLHYHEIFTCNFETWLIDSYEYINVDDSE